MPAPGSVPLLYHALCHGDSAYTYAMPVDQFGAHLRQLAAMPPDARCAQLTFDDGDRSNYELALPALATAARTATFFITAGWTGTRAGYMNAQELRELRQAGMRVGAHGWSHALLTQCSAAELDRELAGPKSFLEDVLGEPVVEMSLPGGRANAAVLRAAQAAGYTSVWTSTPGAVSHASQAVLPRFNVRNTLSAASLASLLAPDGRSLQRARRVSQLKGTAQRLLGDLLYAAAWRVINRAAMDDDDPQAIAGAADSGARP